MVQASPIGGSLGLAPCRTRGGSLRPDLGRKVVPVKLWISTAMSPPGNPYGLVAVVAETKDEAIAKIRAAIEEAGPSNHPPTQQYTRDLLNALDAEIEEVVEGVFVDWSPVSLAAPATTTPNWLPAAPAGSPN